VADEPVPTADVVVTRAVMGQEWGIYALCYMQVCACGETPPEVIEERANALNPSGVGRWSIEWGTDEPHKLPVPCADDPARIHYLLKC